MSYRFQNNTENMDWTRVSGLLSHYGLSQLNAETQQKVFENSYAVQFVFDGDKLIGFGRAISDGICQAAIYNIAEEATNTARALAAKEGLMLGYTSSAATCVAIKTAVALGAGKTVVAIAPDTGEQYLSMPVYRN